MNIRINFDYYDQILNVYGRIISKKQTSHTQISLSNSSPNYADGFVNVYVAKSITTLKKVIQLSLSSKNENLAYAALEVFNFLTFPKNKNQDYSKNYEGYFDDAWLIHNFAKHCIDKGYFPASAFEDVVVDNVKIDTLLSKNLSNNIYSKLRSTLNKIIQEFKI